MFFYSLKKNNRLRVEYIYEVIGLDFAQEDTTSIVFRRMLEAEETKEYLRLDTKGVNRNASVIDWRDVRK